MWRDNSPGNSWDYKIWESELLILLLLAGFEPRPLECQFCAFTTRYPSLHQSIFYYFIRGFLTCSYTDFIFWEFAKKFVNQHNLKFSEAVCISPCSMFCDAGVSIQELDYAKIPKSKAANSGYFWFLYFVYKYIDILYCLCCAHDMYKLVRGVFDQLKEKSREVEWTERCWRYSHRRAKPRKAEFSVMNPSNDQIRKTRLDRTEGSLYMGGVHLRCVRQSGTRVEEHVGVTMTCFDREDQGSWVQCQRYQFYFRWNTLVSGVHPSSEQESTQKVLFCSIEGLTFETSASSWFPRRIAYFHQCYVDSIHHSTCPPTQVNTHFHDNNLFFTMRYRP